MSALEDRAVAEIISRLPDVTSEEFGSLVTHFHEQFLNVARARCKDTPEVGADDIVQIACAKLWANSSQLQNRTVGVFVAWATTAIRNCATDEKKKRRERVLNHQDDEGGGGTLAADVLATSLSEPGLKGEKSEARLRKLSILMKPLSHDERTAVTLQYSDKSCREIAELMDRSFDAVGGLLKRAKAKMRVQRDILISQGNMSGLTSYDHVERRKVENILQNTAHASEKDLRNILLFFCPDLKPRGRVLAESFLSSDSKEMDADLRASIANVVRNCPQAIDAARDYLITELDGLA